jgi:hypothetical protein
MSCSASDEDGSSDGSIMSAPWFVGLILILLVTIVLATVGVLYLRRKQAQTKELGHLHGNHNCHIFPPSRIFGKISYSCHCAASVNPLHL